MEIFLSDRRLATVSIYEYLAPSSFGPAAPKDLGKERVWEVTLTSSMLCIGSDTRHFHSQSIPVLY